MLNDGQRFKETDSGCQVTLSPRQTEWLLQDGFYRFAIPDESITVLDLAKIIAGRAGLPIEHLPDRTSEPPSAYVSPAKAARELGWRSTIRFAEGLERLMTAVPPAIKR